MPLGDCESAGHKERGRMSVTGAGEDHDVYVNSLSVLVCCCGLPESARPGAGKWRGGGGGGGGRGRG